VGQKKMNITLTDSPGRASIVTKKKLLGGSRLCSASLVIPVIIESTEGKEETEIILPEIDLKGIDSKGIKGRILSFPVNPEEGYIDGSVCYAHVHNPVDCDRIEVLSELGAEVSLRLHYTIDFTFEGPEELGKVEETRVTRLSVRTENS
jgi:hypothetical protein